MCWFACCFATRTLGSVVGAPRLSYARQRSSNLGRHCEERSDEAIQLPAPSKRPWIASLALAMTSRSRTRLRVQACKFQPRDLSAEAQSAEAEARIPGLRTKTERWVSVFPFASPSSPNKTRKRNADRRGYSIRILRCGSPLRTSLIIGGRHGGGLACRRPTTALTKGSRRP
jgi:hypothetical protein